MIARTCKQDRYLFCPPDGCGKGKCARFEDAVEQLRQRFSRSCDLPQPANRP